MATSEIMQGLEETDGNSVLISAVPSVQPYQFEPRRPSTPIYSTDSETQSSSDENDHDENDRVDNTNWCECGQCVPMSTQSESCCCRENCLMDNLLVDSGLTCITEHEGLIGNCLNQYVVETSFYEYLDIYGQVGDDEPVHQMYRHVAYRRLARWIWHRLGRGVRKVLPACAVEKIRQKWPSEQYTGFKYARDY